MKEPGNIFVFNLRTGKVIALLLKHNKETDDYVILVLSDEDKSCSYYEPGLIVTINWPPTNLYIQNETNI
jgi:hypothetical protein